MTDKERIEAHLKLLIGFTYQGLVHFRIWKRLIGADRLVTDDEERGKKMAPVFIYMSQKAHFESAFMHLARLLDEHKDATSIIHFLRCIEAKPKILAKDDYQNILSEVGRDCIVLATFKKEIESIKNRRNKFYSHIDKSLIRDSQSAFRNSPLSAKDMEIIFDSVGKILNKYSDFLDKSTTAMEIIGEEDITKLLQYVGLKLTKDKEERMKKWSSKSPKNHLQL